MRIRVALIVDFPLARDGFAMALQRDPGLELVGEAEDAEEGLELVLRTRPDVAVIALGIPADGGLNLVEKLTERAPWVRTLVVSDREGGQTILNAVAVGASGYLSKRAGAAELRQAVITIHGGGAVIPPDLAARAFRSYSEGAHAGNGDGRLLSERERAVLRLVAEGLTDREIGEKLHISPRTVQHHLAAIRLRTGLRRRSELVRWALDEAAL
jgi:DNA-binding NarL/FixJ family response regulator